MTSVTRLSAPPASGEVEHQAANHAKTAFVSVSVGLKRPRQQTLGSAVEYKKQSLFLLEEEWR